MSIVGWYIAYCPIFAGAATECYWSNDDAQDRGPTSLDASFAENVWFPLRVLVEQLSVPSRGMEGHRGLEIRGPHCVRERHEPTRARDAGHQPGRRRFICTFPRRIRLSSGTGAQAHLRPGGSYLDRWITPTGCWGRCSMIFEAQPRWAGDHTHRAGRPLVAHRHVAASAGLERRRRARLRRRQMGSAPGAVDSRAGRAARQHGDSTH